MALPIFQHTVTDLEGDVLASATVDVFKESDGTRPTLYSDRDGNNTISNPVTADSEGFVQFYVAAGDYKIVATSGGDTRTWRYVGIWSPDSDSVTTATGTQTVAVGLDSRVVRVSNYTVFRAKLLAEDYAVDQAIAVDDPLGPNFKVFQDSAGGTATDDGGTIITASGGATSAGEFYAIREDVNRPDLAWFDGVTDANQFIQKPGTKIIRQRSLTTTLLDAIQQFEVVGNPTINSVPMKRANRMPYSTIPVPTGMPLTAKFHVWQNPGGEFDTNIDIWAYERATKNPSCQTYHVDPYEGSDANTGFLPDIPKATIGGASGVFASITSNGFTDAIIYCRAGVYDRTQTWSAPPDANLTFICEPETWFTTRERPQDLTWALDGTGTYKAARSSVSRVVDIKYTSDYGTPESLAEVDSVAACQATTSTFYTDNVDVWVHLQDDRQPDDLVMVLLDVGNGRVDHNGRTIFVKNARFYGGSIGAFGTTGTPASAADTPTVLLEDCHFAYSSEPWDGISAEDWKFSITKRCWAYQNSKDGFNYHIYEGNPSEFIEIDCMGFDNGWQDRETGFNFNGSTSHETAVGVRINSRHFDNYGPNVADVGQAKTWNLGVYVTGSNGSTGTIFNTGFHVNDDLDVTGDAEQWLDTCYSEGNEIDLVCRDSTNQINVVGWEGGYSVSGDGVFAAY